MAREIYNTDFSEYLPQPLKHDEKMLAMAKVLTDKMLELSGITNAVLIYARIDELPEQLLDILAYDFHCDWYDTAYPIETKRRIIKSNVPIHKRLGTLYAVRTALENVYRTAKVEEWFDYGGEPYMFKIRVNIGTEGLTEDTTREIEAKMKFYKNLRSHCEGIFYQLDAETTATIRAAPVLKYGGGIKVKPLLAENIASKTTKNAQAAFMDGATIKVKPLLPTEIATATETTATAAVTESNTIKVKAHVEDSIKSEPAESAARAYIRTKNTLQIRREKNTNGE